MHIHVNSTSSHANKPTLQNPAQTARAALAADAQVDDSPFGQLVSRIARGLPTSDLLPANPSTSTAPPSQSTSETQDSQVQM